MALHILDILNELASDRSRKFKETTLSEITTLVDEFKNVCKLTYDPKYNYYIKDFDFSDVELSVDLEKPTLDDALKFLVEELSTRNISGNLARIHVDSYIKQLNEKDSELFQRVLARDLKCGVSAKTINKVWEGLVYIHPYMRCSSFSEKNLKNITFPCYSQLKIDGLYLDITVVGGDVNAFTRSGQLVNRYLSEGVVDYLKSFDEDLCFSGEMVQIDHEGSVVERKISNGYLNSDDVDPEQLRFYVWDVIDHDAWSDHIDDTPYQQRFVRLNKFSFENTYMTIIDTVVCESKDDILEHFKECRERGEEGTVIKDYSGIWKDGTSKHQIKCKVIFDCELKITDYKLGQGKYENMLGAITGESSDGELVVSVGGGYTDEQRVEFLKHIDKWIEDGQIMTVRGNAVVLDRREESKWSIFLPRFVEIRTDKNEADDLIQIKEQVESFTNALDQIK